MGSLTLTQVLTSRKARGVAHAGPAAVSTHVLLEPKTEKAKEQKVEETKVEGPKSEESKEPKAEAQRKRFKGV